MIHPVEPKKVLCIHDLSGMGRCSLAVILPVLSVMGVQPVALPTVVLSTHTGGLGTPARLDGCAYGEQALEHYHALGVEFDCIYTGYLGGEDQVALAEKAFALWPAAKKIVDPVMGDNGALYAGFSDSFPQAMRALCGRADVLTPNVTEACLLTGTAYSPVQDAAQTRRLLERLLELGCRAAVLTGLRVDGDMAVAALQRDGTGTLVRTSYIPEVFHGTGDLFASTCAGALVQGAPLERAVRLAADYVALTLRRTVQAPDRRWYGVNFQETLPELMARWQNIKEELP